MEYQLIIGRHSLVKKPYYLLGALEEALSYGANALMIYLGAPQNSSRQPSSVFKISEFKKTLVENNIMIDNVVVHGPYLINLANTFNEKIFDYSVEFLKKEVARMEEIGLKTLILHPGNSLGAESEKSLLQIVKGLNLIFQVKGRVRIALETMAGKGSELGINFSQLKFIIDKVDCKERIGVCWDTCHLYSSGYDIKDNLEQVILEFDKKIGLEKLWVIHVNDSIFGFGEGKDRHENIGYGKIGLKSLKKIIWHPKFDGIIKLLETPRKRESFREEIKILKNIFI